MGNARIASIVMLLWPAVTPAGAAEPLTICRIQLTANTNGASDYDGQIVDCVGGIVVGKTDTTRPRVFLHDPSCAGRNIDPEHLDAWCGIQVKDWTWPPELYDAVEIGDWVSLTNVLVEEYVGVTFLQYQSSHNPGFTTSTGYTLPDPLIVSVEDIPAPVHDVQLDTWFVEDHAAEPYESLRLIVRDVTIGDMNLGKALDNYVLEGAGGDRCWAADYMNIDKPAWLKYHGFASPQEHFCAVAGLFEQYTRRDDGWDYYQLVTLESSGMGICGDGNVDGQINTDDLERLAECLTGQLCAPSGPPCNPPTWPAPPADLPLAHCMMMDLDYDGDVDLRDFAGLQIVFSEN